MMRLMLQVAIKKINAVFENPIVAWRTLREVSVPAAVQSTNARTKVTLHTHV